MAMLIFSLGATNFGPPNTWRGTRVNPATVAAVAARNLRRFNGVLTGSGFFTPKFIKRGWNIVAAIGEQGRQVRQDQIFARDPLSRSLGGTKSKSQAPSEAGTPF